MCRCAEARASTPHSGYGNAASDSMLKLKQVFRGIFQHIRKQAVNIASAQLIKMLFNIHKSFPLIQRKIRQPMPQGDVHQALFHNAGADRQRDRIAKLDQKIIIVILCILKKFFEKSLLLRSTVISANISVRIL